MNKTTALGSFQKSFYVCILHYISNSLSDGANFFRVGNFIPRLFNKMPMLPDWQARSKCVFRTNTYTTAFKRNERNWRGTENLRSDLKFSMLAIVENALKQIFRKCIN